MKDIARKQTTILYSKLNNEGCMNKVSADYLSWLNSLYL